MLIFRGVSIAVCAFEEKSGVQNLYNPHRVGNREPELETAQTQYRMVGRLFH